LNEKEELLRGFKILDKTNKATLTKDEIRLVYEQHYGRSLTENELNDIFSPL
jgi:Ca2+-binding EF-hand superfamily protein